MMTDPRYRRSHSLGVPMRDARYSHHPRTSLSENDWEYEPILATISPTALPMTKTILPNAKVLKKTWDSDKALKSTHSGLFGKYQIRAYLFLALGYAVVGAWLTQMPAFALLRPKSIDCTPYYLNESRVTNISSVALTSTSENTTKQLNDQKRITKRPIYNYSKEYGRSALIDFNTLCDKTRIKIPYMIYIVGLILGGLVFGYAADHSGRKMALLGSMWTVCVISIFQLLSDDYISYVFFMLFLGAAIGAVHVITVPVVMEMFPIRTRAIYSLGLLGAVFLFDLAFPWIAFAIKNWKTLQAIVSAPLVLTAALQWCMEESMFWYTAQKDYVAAILSLTKIAHFNGIVFQDVFREARDFLRGKRSKGIQCDFQPLLRLEDIKTLGSKYPDFDLVDLQMSTGKKNTLTQRVLNIITGHHYYPTLSKFYPTDFLRSPILSIYLAVLCGLWLVSSLTEYGLDAPQLTQYLTDSFHVNYFYTRLVQVLSFIVAFPLVYLWGRRWPTFCFFLIAEVCLLGSVAVKLDNDDTRAGMLAVYFIGKFATRAAFIVLIIYTCEIFPTGLRCTALGLCYTFRLVGIALASPEVGEVNDWMPRLIYGVLSLVLGSMALLLPETKAIPLPRTMLQIENLSTSLSKSVRHHRRSALMGSKTKSDKTRLEGQNNFSDTASGIEGTRSGRLYDYQSTMHSIFELQDYGTDDTMHSMHSMHYRHPSRRMDLPSPSFFQPHAPINSEMFRYPQSIAEDVEYADDADNDQTGIALQHRLSEQKILGFSKDPQSTTDDVIVSPVRSPPVIEIQNQSENALTSRFEAAETTDEAKENSNQNQNADLPLPKYRPTISEDENYFSEHC